MINLITMLKDQVRERMNTVPSTLYEYYNGKLDMLLELEIIINANETGKANEMIAEALGYNGFKTIE